MAAQYPVKPRAAGVAAPGAKRITLTGIMAVPDSFGRIRVALVDRLPGQRAADRSCGVLLGEVPCGRGGHAPYVVHAADVDGLRGEFWAVAPAHRKKYWLEVAASLRGQPVRVEVTVRRFSFAAESAAGPDADPSQVAGAALDVAMIEPWTPADI